MTAATLTRSLRELADAYCQDGADYAALRAEESRRARAEKFITGRQAERDQLRADWHDAAFAQYLAAQAACCGHLVRHDSPVADDWQLWAGTEAWARKHCTSDLAEFWDANPRLTVTQYAAAVADGQRIARDDREREVITDDGMAGDAGGDVRCAGTADSGIDVREAGPDGDTGHVRRPGLVTIDDADPDGAKVTVSRDGIELGRALRAQVRVQGAMRSAWWATRPDGTVSLHRDRREAVSAILS